METNAYESTGHESDINWLLDGQLQTNLNHTSQGQTVVNNECSTSNLNHHNVGGGGGGGSNLQVASSISNQTNQVIQQQQNASQQAQQLNVNNNPVGNNSNNLFYGYDGSYYAPTTTTTSQSNQTIQQDSFFHQNELNSYSPNNQPLDLSQRQPIISTITNNSNNNNNNVQQQQQQQSMQQQIQPSTVPYNQLPPPLMSAQNVIHTIGQVPPIQMLNNMNQNQLPPPLMQQYSLNDNLRHSNSNNINNINNISSINSINNQQQQQPQPSMANFYMPNNQDYSYISFPNLGAIGLDYPQHYNGQQHPSISPIITRYNYNNNCPIILSRSNQINQNQIPFGYPQQPSQQTQTNNQLMKIPLYRTIAPDPMRRRTQLYVPPEKKIEKAMPKRGQRVKTFELESLKIGDLILGTMNVGNQKDQKRPIKVKVSFYTKTLIYEFSCNNNRAPASSTTNTFPHCGSRNCSCSNECTCSSSSTYYEDREEDDLSISEPELTYYCVSVDCSTITGINSIDNCFYIIVNTKPKVVGSFNKKRPSDFTAVAENDPVNLALRNCFHCLTVRHAERLKQTLCQPDLGLKDLFNIKIDCNAINYNGRNINDDLKDVTNIQNSCGVKRVKNGTLTPIPACEKGNNDDNGVESTQESKRTKCEI